MATEKAQYAPETVYRDPNAPRATSITAQVVMTIQVSMSTAEMDVLIGSLGKAWETQSKAEKLIQSDFIRAIGALR